MSAKYLIEFIGTFFLVLVIALSGNPIAVGTVLAAVVYMGGHISGSHYNPAVSTTLYLQKKIDSQTLLSYIGAQLLGAIAASSVYLLVQNEYFVPSPGQEVNFWTAALLEMLFTFVLCSVVMQTAVSEKTKGNSYFGLAIGFVVAAGAFAVGPISGAAFNPAVGVGPLLFDFQNLRENLGSVGLYILGPIAGALLASAVYSFTSRK